MATPVIMPRQGQSVESCIITTWHKQVGDSVAEGDVLFTYETDKATFDEAAKEAGTLLAVFFKEDDDVPCLTNVAVLGKPGESFAEFAPDGAAPAASAAAPAAEAPAAPAASIAPLAAVSTAASASAVSPRARMSADRLGVDASLATPTGPNGRVIERDVIELNRSGAAAPVQAAQASPAAQAAPVAQASSAAEAEYEDVKIPNIRKVIAKSMHTSLATMAQLTHNSSFDASQIMAFRKGLKAAAEKKIEVPSITLNDIIIYAVSRVLLKHPDLNAHYLDDHMRYFKHANIGIAVDTPRGLLVPTLFNADQKSLRQIAAEAHELAKSAQDGSISPDLLQGASFTISNLGTLGVEHFTPVINPPQTGILGVDCVIERPKTVNGEIKLYPAMGLSLTYDHRALDGAPASRFLMDLRAALENFNTLLIG